MPNIQLLAEHRLALLEEHRLWCKQLPRVLGQIGGTAYTLVECWLPLRNAVGQVFDPRIAAPWDSVRDRKILHPLQINLREVPWKIWTRCGLAAATARTPHSPERRAGRRNAKFLLRTSDI